MKASRAIVLGLLGAGSISIVSALLRTVHIQISIEMILGTLVGITPGTGAFLVGLGIHLAIGAAFGLLYAWLFEKVWQHGGASVGIILAFLHASLLGMLMGLTPQFHPAIPSLIPNPGAYFSNFGVAAIISFFAMHAVYGAIVGGGYGHVPAERQWAPEGRL